MEFYEKLQKLRKEHGMSQEELASKLGVSRQAVSKWENGQGFPETDKLLLIGNLYQVSMDYLLKNQPALEEENRKYGWIWGIIMPLAAMGFLALGFVWHLWHPGWLVFPIAFIIGAGITGALEAKHKN